MLENSKPRLEKETEEVSDKDNRKFFRIGTIIIGTIVLLMIFCIVMIVILEN